MHGGFFIQFNNQDDFWLNPWFGSFDFDRAFMLQEIVSSSEDISAKTKSVIELKKLQLLELQRRLRR